METMRTQRTTPWAAAALLATVTASAPAFAHFKLMKPTSWLKEDQNPIAGGGPQKGGPCGPGGYDNVNPIPVSGVVTDFHVGDTVEIDMIDTVAHPGYFRVALAANRDDLKNPTIVQDASCNFDETMVPKTASGNVLADGVLYRSRVGFNDAAGKMFTTMVTLPDQPCDKCTLQVMQVMENDIKSLSNCYYFHCADIRILPAGQPTGTGGATGTGGTESGGTSGLGGTLGIGGTLGGAGMLGNGGLLGGAGIPGGAGTLGGAGQPGLSGMLGSAGVGAPGGTGATPGSVTPGASGAVTGGGVSSVPTGGTAGTAAAASPDGQGSDGGCSMSASRKNLAVVPALIALLAVARRRRRAMSPE
jgi:hypothetical protein